MGGLLALVVTLSMRYVEWARGDERRTMIDEKKIVRLKNTIEKHLSTIQALRERVKTLESEQKNSSSLDRNSSSSNLENDNREKVQSLSKDLHETRLLLKAAKEDCARLEADLTSATDKLTESSLEVSKARVATNFITGEFDKVSEERNSLRDSNSAMRAELDRVHEVLVSDNAALSEARIALEAARSEISAMNIVLGEKEDTIANLQDRLNGVDARLKKSEQQNSQYESDLQEMRIHLLIMGDSVKNFCQELDGMKNSAARYEDEQNSLKADLERIKEWKDTVESVLAPGSIKSLKFLLENMITMLDEDSKLPTPKHSDIVTSVHDAMNSVLALLDKFEAEYQT